MGTTEDSATTRADATATAPSETMTDRGDRRSRGGRGRGDNRRGGGRGGRGGRTAAAPQGQVFFTATPKPPTTTSSKKVRSGRAGDTGSMSAVDAPSVSSPSSNKGKNDAATNSMDATPDPTVSNEEVVGILEEGVGGETEDSKSTNPSTKVMKAKAKANAKAKSPTPEDDHASMDVDHDPGDNEVKVAASIRLTVPRSGVYEGDAFFYDDDSSHDEVEGNGSDTEMPDVAVEPIELPRPGAGDSVPLDRSIEAQASTVVASSSIQHTAAYGNKDEWFLLQLPTRLPPLKGSSSAAAKQVSDPTDEAGSSSVSQAPQVSVAPVHENRFDNALATAVPGQLGKLVTYKSGRSELILEGPNGAPRIRMDLTEYSSKIHQQAVSINPDAGELVVLGDVTRTMVATPKLPHDS